MSKYLRIDRKNGFLGAISKRKRNDLLRFQKCLNTENGSEGSIITTHG